MNAATRILSPTGIITSEDRSQVLEHAAEILAYMRNHPRDESCSPECGSIQGVLAAALLCMSDDVAKLDMEDSAHEGALATAELKAAYCTRQPAPAAMVDLRRPRTASMVGIVARAVVFYGCGPGTCGCDVGEVLAFREMA